MAVKQIFFDETGPLVEFDGEILWVEDLNPHITTKWRMSRFEMVAFGLRAIVAAILARKPSA
jgi:hypothetical protein